MSLFSNCGAGDLGYAQAGFAFEVLAEIDDRRLHVASLNHPGAERVPGDLRATWRQTVTAYRERCGEDPPALLAACPPCQGMSSARAGRGMEADADAGSRDGRNLLVSVIARVTHALHPRAVVVENVPAFLTRKVRHPRTGVPISAALLLLRSLRQRYAAFALLADMADYGVPQTRKRVFVMFVRRDEPGLARLLARGRAPFPRPTHAPDYGGFTHITLRMALKELGAEALDASAPETAGGGHHSVPVWEDSRYSLVAAIPPFTGEGAWTSTACSRCGDVEVGRDATRCPACGGPLARPLVTDEKGDYRFIRGFRASSYTRMHADRPAATVTTASGSIGSDRTLHPWQNRVLSPLECAHLQTFPPNFEWGEALAEYGATHVRAMIGEAVPPQFTGLHGDVLSGVLTGRWTRAAIAASDPRVRAASRKLGKPSRSSD